MPQSNEGILLLIGALFLLLGLLGGGFEISAIKMPSVGKFTRVFALVIGTVVFGIGLFRLLFPANQPIAVAIVPTAPPATTTPIVITATPIPPTDTPPQLPTQTRVPPTLAVATNTAPATSLPVAALIQDITVDYDQTRFEKKGMVIHVKFSITGLKGIECRATAYFAMQSGDALKDVNGEYNTTDGQVSTGVSFTPGYEVTQYDNLELFIPYDELELGPGAYDLKFHVELWERAHPEKPALAISPDVNFTFTK